MKEKLIAFLHTKAIRDVPGPIKDAPEQQNESHGINCKSHLRTTVIVGPPPSNLKRYSVLVQTPPKPPEPCAVCSREPTGKTRVLRFGPVLLRKRKNPLPAHFVLVENGREHGRAKNYHKKSREKLQQEQRISCCRECFDFFRSIVLRHRDCALQSPPPNLTRCVEGTGNCVIYPTENNDFSEKGERCAACWLDRCLLAGLRAEAVATESCFSWLSKKAQDRVRQLDVAFSWRLKKLRERQQSLVQMQEIVVDENVLELGLLKSMAYVDAQFSNLRLVCSSTGRINRVFKMFEHLSIADMANSFPVLMGSTHSQKKLLFAEDLMMRENACKHIDCAVPNIPCCDRADYVNVPLAHNDRFFANVFFSYLDIFLSFEIAHTMPVFRLLDKKDIVVQLAYASFFCRALAQVSFSATLDVPEIVQPNGDLTHRTMCAVVRKAQRAIAIKQQQTNFISSYSPLKEEPAETEEEENFSTRIEKNAQNRLDVEMVPIRVLAAPDLLKKYEETSRRMRIDLLQPFLRAKLSTTEVLLLRAILITSPSPSGLSENARLLLEIERNKDIKLLKNHLRKELGTEQAAEQRFTELLALLDVVAELRNLAGVLGQLAFVLFKIPVHRHTGEAEDQRSYPVFMTECRAFRHKCRAFRHAVYSIL